MLRIGLGHDTHRLIDGTSILLGGVRIEHTKSLLGHSDADVLLHAVTDALLGAAGLGDIGELFPDTDPVNRNRNSAEMLQIAWEQVKKNHWQIVNLDIILFAEKPKIITYKEAIRKRIAELLEIDVVQIGLQAKTGEKIGIIGREEAISAECVVLLQASQSQQQFTAEQKFGLAWEDKPEKIVELCETKQPVLNEVIERHIKRRQTADGRRRQKNVLLADCSNLPAHLIIEGDNYHALSVLSETHAEKIDLIYIDPPYNTGNKEFIYNDRHVDKEDRYRHSRWLSFMEKRLVLARNLLTEHGIIFISIDDHEVANLRLLCDEIFGEEHFCAIVHWRKNRKPHNAGATMTTSYEFILVYYKSIHFKLAQEFAEMKTDEKGNYAVYPILKADKRERIYTIKAGTRCGIGHIEAKVYQAERNADLNIEYLDASDVVDGRTSTDIRLKARFCLTDERGKLSAAMNADNIFINSNGFPKEKRYRTENDVKVDNHHWDIEKGKNEDANEELEKLFHLKVANNVFTNPKPTALIKKIVSTINRNDITILDFFAGSGTTGHAVLELNAADGGTRQFILCTNNENGIAENVTYPRIKKVIEGYGEKEGIPAEVRYFRTGFIEKEEIADV